MKNNDVKTVELSTGKGLSKTERSELCRQYRAKLYPLVKEYIDVGCSIKQTSEYLGLSYKMVYKIVDEYSLTVNPSYNYCSLVSSRPHLKIYSYYWGIPEGWDVHHINGIHTDNRLDNLVALPHEVHTIVHKLKDKEGVTTILTEYLQVKGSASALIESEI